ncbi:Pentatricopeptide repeat-containing protein, mitochondrial [Sesamum alatum]|uniref:O-fucosyltransferase family protein n=1 Tax=Sesamum alatum TaxID=300844 RepID=A0AAE1YS32_9LAMI|nr:Pentatricopeptide repeat-containing protein, mitochondrial [Sesamum alatum]
MVVANKAWRCSGGVLVNNLAADILQQQKQKQKQLLSPQQLRCWNYQPWRRRRVVPWTAVCGLLLFVVGLISLFTGHVASDLEWYSQRLVKRTWYYKRDGSDRAPIDIWKSRFSNLYWVAAIEALVLRVTAIRERFSNGYLLIATSGGLNQQGTGITDAVVVGRILNATSVVSELDHHSFWKDERLGLGKDLLLSFCPFCSPLGPLATEGSATLHFGNPMLVLKSAKLYKRLYSCSSVADSEASYLTKHIDSFLSNSVLNSRTLCSTHAYIITTGHAHNRFMASKLIASYASFNQPHSSTKVFYSLSSKDPFLWNSIIKAHFSNGNYVQAVEFFSKMTFFGNLPNQFTIPMVVSACAELGSLCVGMNVHGLASKLNLFCGNSADVVAWTALVIGYVQNGESESGLQCLREMHGIGGYDGRPNFRTLEGGFQACGNLSALTEGRCLHGFALKSGILSSHIVQSAVLSMYSKCGSIEDARVSFCEVVNKDLFSWTSFIGVYAKLGFANSMKVLEGKAFHGFILRRNLDVDQIVYSSLMAMYCKFGLLALAENIFVGDLYGRSGCLDEAESLVSSMPFAPDGGIWGSLLTACKMHNNAEMGIKIAKRAIETDPENDGYYILMSDFYSSVEMWKEVEQVRKTMKDRGVRKTMGWSTV